MLLVQICGAVYQHVVRDLAGCKGLLRGVVVDRLHDLFLHGQYCQWAIC